MLLMKSAVPIVVEWSFFEISEVWSSCSGAFRGRWLSVDVFPFWDLLCSCGPGTVLSFRMLWLRVVHMYCELTQLTCWYLEILYSCSGGDHPLFQNSVTQSRSHVLWTYSESSVISPFSCYFEYFAHWLFLWVGYALSVSRPFSIPNWA